MPKTVVKIITILTLLFTVLVLGLSLRGKPGNPTLEELSSLSWTEDGPFELSPERGRFALTISLVEDKSFHFSTSIARFATPDLGYDDGNYVSLFAPGTSFAVIPGYILGKHLGNSQVGSFAIIAVFAFLNTVLVSAIARQLGASSLASLLGGLVFLFATPAFTYAVTLYQHHISTFFLLAGIFLLLKFRSWWSLAGVWFLIGLNIAVDYPNGLLMLPVVVMALLRLFQHKKVQNWLIIKFHSLGLITLIGMAVPLAFLLWFNYKSYGDYFQLAGTVPRVEAFTEDGLPTSPTETDPQNFMAFLEKERVSKTALGFFQTRNLLNGFYIHFISPDRGIIMYAPIVLFGMMGLFVLAKVKPAVSNFFLSIIGLNVLVYSLWGDPWGGWAFGSRYLIPSYALFSILIAYVLSHQKHHFLFYGIFLLVMGYSVAVNTLGAITTSSNPPQVQVLSLEAKSGKEEKYTYERNFDTLKTDPLKTYVFQAYAYNQVSSLNYYLALIFGITSVMALLLILLAKEGS